MVQERSFKGLLDGCYQFMNLYIFGSHYYRTCQKGKGCAQRDIAQATLSPI